MRRLASRQRGLVTRGQLLQAGVGRGAIVHRLETRWLVLVHRGVYRLGHDAPVAFQDEMAAALWAGGHGVLSHRSAAAVWGVWEDGAQKPVDLTLVARDRRSHPGLRVHRAPALDPEDFRVRDGLPVTAPARTLVDLAADRALERAVSEMRLRGLVADSAMRAALDRAAGRTGIARLREMLAAEAESGFTRSEAERRLRALVRRAQLPEPRFNVRLHGLEVDAVWPAARLVLEVDGFGAHGHRAAFERDRRRDQRLAAAGYRVLRVTWRQLTGEPMAAAVRIGQALTAAALETGRT